MNITAEHVVSFGGWLLALLTAIGGGVKWLVSTRDQRARMIDEAVEKHVARIEARLSSAERRADRLENEKGRLELGFQMLAAELERLDPSSTILRRAQGLFAAAYPITSELPDPMADLMDELHERTKR